MSKKPSVPEKSDRLKNLPVARPRKAPPKPVPYNVHRAEVTKKPDPVPRKVSRQGNGVPETNLPTDTRCIEVSNGSGSHVGESSPPRLPQPRKQISKQSPPEVELGGIASRPRLDTPVAPPDPEVAPRNEVLPPPLPPARARVPAPLPSRPRPSPPEKKRPGAEVSASGKPPLPPIQSDVRNGAGETSMPEAYSGSGPTNQTVDDTESDLYSTINDGPRNIRAATPQQTTPPTPLSRSQTPPVPLPRSSHPTSPVPPSATTPPSSEYGVTSHSVTTKAHSPLLVPDPTPPDTYSMLARPDQPAKSLNPAPSGGGRQTYSSLELDGIQKLAPLANLVWVSSLF
jgi:hypothetical protein